MKKAIAAVLQFAKTTAKQINTKTMPCFKAVVPKHSLLGPPLAQKKIFAGKYYLLAIVSSFLDCAPEIDR